MRILPPASLPARDSTRNEGRRGAPASVRDNADIRPVAAAPENRARAGGSCVLWNVVVLDLAYSVDSRRQTIDGGSPIHHLAQSTDSPLLFGSRNSRC